MVWDIATPLKQFQHRILVVGFFLLFYSYLDSEQLTFCQIFSVKLICIRKIILFLFHSEQLVQGLGTSMLVPCASSAHLMGNKLVNISVLWAMWSLLQTLSSAWSGEISHRRYESWPAWLRSDNTASAKSGRWLEFADPFPRLLVFPH